VGAILVQAGCASGSTTTKFDASREAVEEIFNTFSSANMKVDKERKNNDTRRIL
jgi:hypothetical protein